MELTEGQLLALGTICDTICPAGNTSVRTRPSRVLPYGDSVRTRPSRVVPHGGVSSATELGVPQAIVEQMERNPREADHKQLAQLLGMWDTPVMTLIGGGGFRRFSELSQEERESVLLSWCDSRVPHRRAAFHALRKAALILYWLQPGPNGGRNPAWDAIEYTGPLGAYPDAPPKALEPLRIDGDTDLDCDVVVVGSGAGGGTAAGVLAAAGLDVVVLEAGDYFDDADFDGSEHTALGQMYSGAPPASADQGITLLAGECLGGGTVINYSTSFRTPDEVREEWASHGVSAFTSDDYTDSLDAVCERLGVNHEHSAPSSRDRTLRDGCVALGWHIDAMPRNVRGCDQGENCGHCGLGCRLGAKQSVTKTWLADAAGAGARLVVRTRARQVIVDGGRARGVEAVTRDGHRVTVRSRAVVAACGSIQTPALLRRSGLSNASIGRNLKLHPVTVVWALFDEEKKPWEGTMQALYSDQHRDLDDGYGLKYETAPVHPHLAVTLWPWRGRRAHLDLMGGLRHASGVGILLRDRDGGEVRVGRDGEPTVHYGLSGYDLDHMRIGVDGAAQILEAAGARRVFSSHSSWVTYAPGADGDRARFMADADACGWGSNQCQLGSFHIMGTARMGGTPATSATTPGGETWDVRGLYVCDASAFPTASGVNPMISIESVAHMNARGIVAALA